MSVIKRAICKECDKQFEIYDLLAINQQRCPQCIAAKHDHIRSIPLTRKAIFHDIVTIKSLPGQWREMRSKTSHDAPYWKIDISGRDMADGWLVEPPIGRIVINAARPFENGERVRCRIVRTLHDTKDGNQEVREYMALSDAPKDMYSAYDLSWLEVEDAETPPVELNWHEVEGAWQRFVFAGGRSGRLILNRLGEDEFYGFDDVFDEVLLGDSTLVKLREV